jgi:hypothetical protein
MRLNEITVADQPDAWRAAGFTVDNDRVCIGNSFVIHLTGQPGGGIKEWTLGVDGRVAPASSCPGGMPLAVTAPARPDAPSPHENGVIHAMKAVILTAETAPSIKRLQDEVPELGAPPREGKSDDGAHFAIWPLEDFEDGLEVVCLDPNQGDDVMLAIFLVVADLDETIERIGANDVTPVDIYSGRRRVIIKPRIGVTAGVHLLAKDAEPVT